VHTDDERYRVFYWFGEHYDTALLVQALLMVLVQLTLLKVALDNRPPTGEKNGIHHIPFTGNTRSSPLEELLSGRRPYDFWRWGNSKSYFVFLGYFAGSLAMVQILLPFVAYNPTYVALLGYVGLAIEATLPLPQIWKNHTARSCRGFRLSVIVNWLAGDTMKMMYFFGASEPVPWPFKLCGMFQAMCDCYLGLQFWMYGSGSGRGFEGRGSVREVEMPTMGVVTGKEMLS
jgi:solute carrier family 66, member 2